MQPMTEKEKMNYSGGIARDEWILSLLLSLLPLPPRQIQNPSKGKLMEVTLKPQTSMIQRQQCANQAGPSPRHLNLQK
jgi:hypothetical protein